MANYEAENEFVFDLKKMVQLIGRGLQIGVILQIFFCGCMMYFTNFYTLSGETINYKVTIKYFMAYAYPDNPESSMEALDVEPQLRQYASAFDNRISEKTMQLPGNWYQELANFTSGGKYEHVVLLLKCSFFSYILSLLYIWYFIDKSKSRPIEEYMRGSKIISQKKFDGYWQAQSKGSGIRIGTTIIPDDMVTKHILILGTTGTGKGVLINQMIEQIKKKQANSVSELPPKILFYDIKGEFVQKHYQAGDVIFNPFDNRCVGWSVFQEFTTEPELDAISKALFLAPSKTNVFFYDSASTIFRAGLLYLVRNKKTTNDALWNFFSADRDTIVKAIKTLPDGERDALKFLSADGGETTASVLATLMQQIAFFKNLRGLDGDFSFRAWASKPTRQNVFLLNIAEYSKAFAPLMTMIMDLMCRTMLSLPDDLHRRVYFILDEIGTLDKMDSLIPLETVGRSKGVSLICASQDFGQIAEKYGKDNLQTFINNFNTNFYFRLNDPKTARDIADGIGKQQVKRKAENHSINVKEDTANKSNNEQEHTEYLVMPEELQQLPVGTAYCRISEYDITKLKIPQKYMENKNPAFIPRKFASLFEDKQIEQDVEENNQINLPETSVKLREFKI